jgi:hypothetical protein
LAGLARATAAEAARDVTRAPVSRLGVLDSVNRLTMAAQQFTEVQERLVAGDGASVRRAAGELRRSLVELAEPTDVFPASDLAILKSALATVQRVEAALVVVAKRGVDVQDVRDAERARLELPHHLVAGRDEVYAILARLRAQVVRRINDL